MVFNVSRTLEGEDIWAPQKASAFPVPSGWLITTLLKAQGEVQI